MIEIKECKYGRGLFATQTIPKGTIIEESPVLVIPKNQLDALSYTLVHIYVYAFGRHGVALALGNGSLFNHSPTPNVLYKAEFSKKIIKYRTAKTIRKGSQLFIDYGYSIKESLEFLEDLKQNPFEMPFGEESFKNSF